MLKKVFNVAALAGHAFVDTVSAPVESFKIFRDTALASYSSMRGSSRNKDADKNTAGDKMVANFYAAGTTATFGIGGMTLGWAGLFTLGVTSLPVVGVGGLIIGCATPALLAKPAAAYVNKDKPEDEKVEDNIYANTIKHYKKLTNDQTNF